MAEEIKGQEEQEQVVPLVAETKPEQATEAVPTPPVEDYKAKYQESEARRRGQDREISKLQALLQKKDLSIEKRLDAMAAVMFKKKPDEFEEKPEPSDRELYEQALKPTPQDEAGLQVAQAQLSKEGQRIAARITKAGLDPNGPEFKAAQETFTQGRVDEASDMVDEILFASLKTKAEAAKNQQAETRAERREQLKSETGTGGPLSTFKQIEEAYADGQVDYATYKKARQQKGLS